MRPRVCIGLLAFASLFTAAVAPTAQERDSRRAKLYVLNSHKDSVSIVDVATNTIMKTIRVGATPHGLAANKEQTRVYISTEGDDGLTVVDAVRDVAIKRYLIGRLPNEVEITADGRFVYVPAAGDFEYQVFDTVKEAIVARLGPVKGTPHNVVVSPDGRYMYFASYERPDFPPLKEIHVVDTRTHSLVGTIPLPGIAHPIAISPNGKRLYVNNTGGMQFAVVDLEARKVVAEAKSPKGAGAHGIVVVKDGKEVWSVSGSGGRVHVFDVTVTPPKEVHTFESEDLGGRLGSWATATLDGKTVYVSSVDKDVVTAYDVATRTEKARITFQARFGPKRMIVVNAPRTSS